MIKLPFSFKPHKDSRKFLAIDIASNSIHCVALFQDNDVVKIIGAGKYDLDMGIVRGGTIIDYDKVEEGLKIAISHATSGMEESSKIKDVIFGTRDDLSLGLMTTARTTRENNSVITQKEVNEIYEKVTNSSYIQANNELLQTTGTSDIELDLVTSSVIYSKVDGTRVPNIVGLNGQEIELAIFTAFTPTYHIKALQKLARNLGLNILAVGAESYALVRLLKQAAAAHQAFDCVVIDIGSDTTDVAIVFGGGIVAIKSLHIGEDDLVSEISKSMGITHNEAERLKQSYCEGKLDQSENLIVQNCLHDALTIWLDGLELLFGEFTGVKTFASKVFVCGKGADIPDIMLMLSKEPWTRSIPFKCPPEFMKLSIHNFDKITDSTGTAQGTEWFLTACLSVIYLEMKGLI